MNFKYTTMSWILSQLPGLQVFSQRSVVALVHSAGGGNPILSQICSSVATYIKVGPGRSGNDSKEMFSQKRYGRR